MQIAIKYLLLIALSILFGQSAYAVTFPAPFDVYVLQTDTTQTNNSAEALCAARLALKAVPVSSSTNVIGTTVQCTKTFKNSGSTTVNTEFDTILIKYTCPVGSTISGTGVVTSTNYAYGGPATCTSSITCTLPAVFDSISNSCKTCTVGTVVDSMTVSNIKSMPANEECSAGCLAPMSSTPMAQVCYPPQQGFPASCVVPALLEWKLNGKFCKGGGTALSPPQTNNNPPVTAPPTPCPICDCLKAGKGYGTVNGAVVCTAKNATGSAPVTTTPAPTVSTSTPAPTASDPNPTPVTTVTNNPSTTVTPPPAGSPAGATPTVTTNQVKDDGSTTGTSDSLDVYCQKNPNSATCKTKTQCESDPESASCKFLCEKYPDIIACQKPEDIIGKPSDIPSDGDLEEKEIDVNSYAQVSIPSSNSCPSPRSMNIAGHTMTVTFQPACDYASYFKPLLITFALMFAINIVMGTVRKES